MSRPNETTLQLLRSLEGLPGARPALHAYRDQAGVLTIGYGHTGVLPLTSPAMPLTESTTITEEEADRLLLWDALDAAQYVDKYVTVPLNDNQYGALVLFIFNTGASAFRKSTLLRLLNAGDFTGAAQQFDAWVYYHDEAGKAQISRGLQARRATEKSLFLTPVAIADAPVPQAAATFGAGTASPPPTSVLQTRSGKAQIGALLTGGTAAIVEGIQQVQPLADGARTAASITRGLPPWLSAAVSVMVAASIACVAWNLWMKHRGMKRGEL